MIVKFVPIGIPDSRRLVNMVEVSCCYSRKEFYYVSTLLTYRQIVFQSTGRSGGQVRDEYRDTYDEGRGGMRFFFVK